MNFNIDLCNHVTLLLYSGIRVTLVFRISSLTRTEPRICHSAGPRFRLVNKIHIVVANRPFEGLLTNFFAVVKTLPKEMLLSYDTMSPSTFPVTGDIIAKIYDSLSLMMYQTGVATIQKPRTKIIDLSFSASNDKISSSTPSYQMPLILRRVKTGHSHTPRQGSMTLKSVALRADFPRSKIEDRW